ncbi:flagellar biosynthesis protein, FlhG [Caballeronia arationis]|uniref:MinD-like ATPase involved in chromosome partitioning or flagellar assembly n=1 Tax=Caballeronia arationis TaxID=1777142 RepID=A0A7Z7IDE1_9BURK|nr:flagellar biosynthesis protein FlhG [Caballeronia arationis]SAK42995.1 flagellar biosynthesis protein, FlhG [Caballeronia arationis]SOE83105.1 MinD-like ATPase involved in chromosome partitioning or flagellar assembly [Caballeronia arationis]
MDKFVLDQAEGLRRLLTNAGSRVVAVAGGPAGIGCTSTVANLAAALAIHGRDVLVIDERQNAGSLSKMLGLNDTGALASVMSGRRFLQDAVTRTPFGFSLLAAPRDERISHDAGQCRALLDGPADIVLIDSQLDRNGALSSLAAQAHDFLIVTRVAAAAITEAYACMKRLHYAHAIGQFRVLVNHVQNATDAVTAFENLSGVASRYLAVSLAQAGYVAEDARVSRARELARCAVEAFPATPAARDYRQIAAELLHWPMRPAPLRRDDIERGMTAMKGAGDGQSECRAGAPAARELSSTASM